MADGGPRTRRPVLVVDDEELARKSFERAFEGLWPVLDAACVREARAALEGRRLAALVIDGRLPDGSGVAVIEAARALQPALPILAVTGYPQDHPFVQAALAAGAEYGNKPCSLRPFVRRLAIREHVRDVILLRCLDALAAAHGLSLRETEVLTLAADDLGHEAIARRLGLSVHTVRDYAREAARKCDARFGDLVYEVRSRAKGERDRT